MNARKKPPREDGSERRLPLGVVVALVLLGGGLIGLVSLMSLNWMLRSEPFWSLPTPPTQRGRPQPLEIVKVALTIVAGVGGLVALTVAYRRQVWLEADAAGDRERQKALHDRYSAAVAQLAHDNPNVRLAGVYALANLADEWETQRQQCVDVLCAYLRTPWNPEPDHEHPLARKSIETPGPRRTTRTYTYASQLGEGEVRRTVIRTIADHLRDPEMMGTETGPWSGLKFDLTDAILPKADFSRCAFSWVRFERAHFLEAGDFECATFSGPADFARVTFSGTADFTGVTFSVFAWFVEATFSGAARFSRATFLVSAVFQRATFSGPADFKEATFSGRVKGAGLSYSEFEGLQSAGLVDVAFSGPAADFGEAVFCGPVVFERATLFEPVNCKGARFAENPNWTGARFSRPADKSTKFVTRLNAIAQRLAGEKLDQ